MKGACACAADGLAFAAAPAFAILGVLTTTGGVSAQMLCMAQPGSPFGGMAVMYLLMSALHAGPWLKLIASRRGQERRTAVRIHLQPLAIAAPTP